jgi:hypothetical protein
MTTETPMIIALRAALQAAETVYAQKDDHTATAIYSLGMEAVKSVRDALKWSSDYTSFRLQSGIEMFHTVDATKEGPVEHTSIQRGWTWSGEIDPRDVNSWLYTLGEPGGIESLVQLVIDHNAKATSSMDARAMAARAVIAAMKALKA